MVVILSGNGLKIFLPLLYYSNKVFRKKLFHRVVGGALDEFLKKNPKYVKYLNAFEVNWVQSENLVKKLNAVGLTNAEYLENFREITPVVLPEERKPFEKTFYFCTFCRVSETKGIGLAIKSVSEINAIMGEGTAVLHIYGPVEEAFSEVFYKLLEEHSSCVEYKGSVPSSQAVDTLKNYYMHLFPTTWDGEGFPGTLIDCYNAALPTIASDWAYNSEFVVEGETGYLYDYRTPEQLTNKIAKAIENNNNVWRMKENCLEEAKKYKSERVIAKIIGRIIG